MCVPELLSFLRDSGWGQELKAGMLQMVQPRDCC